MKAEVLFPFRGVPDGEIHPRQFRRGAIIEGDLARAMVDAGYAIENKALGAAPQNKGVAGSGDERPTGGRTGAEKPASSSHQGRAPRTRLSLSRKGEQE